VSDFVLESALDRAAEALADRRVFELDGFHCGEDASWFAFTRWWWAGWLPTSTDHLGSRAQRQLIF
jgi:hypothetical protein